MKLSPFSVLTLCLLLIAGRPTQVSAGATQVMLFGQPCQLQGPSGLGESQLKTIHQISPEQTPLSDSLQNLQSSLERLNQTAEVPEAIQRYVKRRTKAAKARVAFEEALQSARKSRNPALFTEAIRPWVHPRRLKSMTSRFEKALKAGNSPSAWDQIRSDFAEIAGPDGEEDFHRALRKLKVVYQCSFESFDDEQQPPERTTAPDPTPGSASDKGLQKPASDHGDGDRSKQ